MQWIRLSLDDHEDFPLSHCRKVVFAVLALAILVISIYSNSLDCSWQFDDEPNITENTNLHMDRITWDGFISALYSNPSSPGELHRPAACLSFALNYYAGGLDVLGYHIVNICVHFLSSLFLFLFILHTLNLPRLKGRYSRHSYSIALISTVLWAVNPIQTQAVTYIVQRMASMAGMFYIMAMYFYLKARTTKKGFHSKTFLILCFLAFAMAVGSKENAVILPLSLFLYEILLLQETAMRHIKKNTRFLFLVMLGILVLGFAMIYSQGGNIFSFLDGYADRPFTPIQRLLTEPRIIIFYISLLLYPISTRLNLAHAAQVSNSLTEPLSTAISILMILGILILGGWLSKKRPLMSFCIFFFFLNHLVESTVFPLELVFEHRNYIPSMLFFVPIAVGWCRLFDYYTPKRPMQYVLSGFLVLVLIGLGHSTFIRNMTWKNPESLWIDAVEKSPNLARARNNLGRHYFQKGHVEKAIFQFEKALEMPVYNRSDEKFITNYNLGRIYRELKDYGKALQYYKMAAALNPFYAPTYNNIGGLMEREGKYERSYRCLIQALKLDPGDPTVNYNLGIHYLKEGQPDRALLHMKKAAGMKAFRGKALLYLGIAYKQKGQLGRAFTYFTNTAIMEGTGDITPHLHLTEVFYRASHADKARQEAEKALRMIRGKDMFDKMLEALTKTDRSSRLRPSAAVIIPLLRDACLGRADDLKEWGKLLSEREGLQGNEKQKTGR